MDTAEASKEIFPDNVLTFLDKCSISVLDATQKAAAVQYTPFSGNVSQQGGFGEIRQHDEILFSNMHLYKIYEAVLLMVHNALFKDRTENGAIKAIKFIDDYLNIKDFNEARRYNGTRIAVELIKIAISKKQTTCLT